MRALNLMFAALLAGAATIPAAAQDRFGSAVVVRGEEIIAVKPGLGRGPAAVLVYRSEESGWRLARRLVTPGAAERGHGLAASLALTDDLLITGSGDPSPRWAAHTWRRGTAGWVPAADVALDEADPGSESVTLETVMRILQPPPRVVAAHGDLALVGLGNQLRLFRHGATGWDPVATLSPPSGMRLEGDRTRLALGSDIALVGLPQAGRVLVFGGDRWNRHTTITPSNLPAGGFGTAVVLNGSTLAVGAPRAGSGTVILYERDSAGGFVERERLAGDSTARAGFGAALALGGDELLVSAPGSARIHRYVRRGGSWRPTDALTMPDVRPEWGFGAALALGRDLAAVGAPGADGARGRVAAYRRAANGTFGAGQWIALEGGLVSITGRQVRCADGTASGFTCDNVDLQSFLTVQDLGGGPGERVSDLWGWTDPVTGREIALVGRTGGLVFVDVTDPISPRVLGWVAANPSPARDVKVYRDHAFFTGDGAGPHGLVVFDLTSLRDRTGPPAAWEPDTIYRGIASAHNLAIDTASALAVPVAASAGGETCGGGLHLVDIREPKRPRFAGCYTDTEGLLHPGRTHDAQCVVYQGPDAEHRGRQICFASNETALRIVDVTDRAVPRPLAAAAYPGVAYIHQGWLTEDHRYFYLDDELDELVGTTERTRTMIWDVADLDDPVMIGTYFGPDGATDHNLFVKGNRMYQANYQAGLRVIDVSDPLRPVEVGSFDTTPYEGNPPGFNGAWTAYPFFESGNVIVSSMGEGLFILRPRTGPLLP